jgi:rod shape determining protein RodA
MQFGATVVGLIFMFLIAALDYRTLSEKLGLILYGGAVLLLAVTLVFGTNEGENRSWLYIPGVPFGIQPSEFVKAVFFLTFSYHLFKVKKRINKPKTLIWLLAHAGIVVGLILVSGDLGVALVYVGIIAVMLFCAGLNLWYFLGAAVAAVAAWPLVWHFLRDDQKMRILVGFNPDLDPEGKGFQPILSRSAVANGGFFGRGIFGGSVFDGLPAAHTDFIFGTYAEKFGFVGSVIIIGLLVFIVIRAVKLSKATRGDCGTYICAGFAGMIIVQTIENIGMCLGMLPVIGITLPYMSYGGSSVLAIYITTGIIQSVAVHRNRLHVDHKNY